MRECSPIELASSDTKSRAYFRHTRWNRKGDAQGVDIVCCTIFMTTDLDANVADTSLESSQEHILENLTFHWTY